MFILFLLPLLLTDVGTEALREEVFFPQSCSQLLAELGFRPARYIPHLPESFSALGIGVVVGGRG